MSQINPKFGYVAPDGEDRQYPLEKVTNNILKHVLDGIFFLNDRMKIQPYYSQSLEKILGLVDLGNKNFINLLENRIPSQIIDSTKEYLELMFRSDLDEEVINELNPLNETEFFYEDEWGIWTSSKYLSFTFKRIMEEGVISQLSSTIQDVTERALLKKKIQTEEVFSEEEVLS